MADLDMLVEALDLAHFELGEAMTDFPDADLWRRPHPRLLSVGEIVAHIGYGEATYFLGDDFESPLTTKAARYYAHNVDAPYSLSMTAPDMFAEVTRIHEAGKAVLAANPPNLDAINLHRGDWTWKETLKYQAFHIAYHTGQIYSARHLLGHETIDN